MSDALRALLAAEAERAGFDALGVAAIPREWAAARRLDDFLAAGRHGDMDWLETTAERRRHPQAMWADALSAVMLGVSYAPDYDPLAVLAEPTRAAVSCYAKGKDYHDILKPRLKQVARAFATASGAQVKVFVDTAPLMEKPLAALAGLGWQGRHTNLVARRGGSWLFLGAILTDAVIAADAPAEDACGSCRACLDICPTRAFPAPYQLDARRCISYLTIEHHGHIPRELRALMGNRVFGCDDCLAVCPWNKFAVAGREHRLAARAETDNPPLAELLDLDEDGFRARFRGTPVRRAGRDRLVRNAMVAAGNSGDATLAPAVQRRLADPSPLVRAMAVWALARLVSRADFASLAADLADRECDGEVRAEWGAELSS